MTRVVFEEVSLSGHKHGTCIACGKKRERAQRFFQTLNPFNRNAAGLPKSRAEIVEELEAKRAKWWAEPFVCRSCDPR